MGHESAIGFSQRSFAQLPRMKSGTRPSAPAAAIRIGTYGSGREQQHRDDRRAARARQSRHRTRSEPGRQPHDRAAGLHEKRAHFALRGHEDRDQDRGHAVQRGKHRQQLRSRASIERARRARASPTSCSASSITGIVGAFRATRARALGMHMFRHQSSIGRAEFVRNWTEVAGRPRGLASPKRELLRCRGVAYCGRAKPRACGFA